MCVARLCFVLDASHYIPSSSSKPALPLKSTPTYDKSNITTSCLLHHVKKSTVNLMVEGSFPNLGERLVNLSMRGLVTWRAIIATCGCICGIHSRKNETKKKPYSKWFFLPVLHLDIFSLTFLKNPTLHLNNLGSKPWMAKEIWDLEVIWALALLINLVI